MKSRASILSFKAGAFTCAAGFLNMKKLMFTADYFSAGLLESRFWLGLCFGMILYSAAGFTGLLIRPLDIKYRSSVYSLLVQL